MKKTILISVLILLVSASVQAGAKGSLLIIGGGDRPDGLTRKFVELARGFGSGKIVIFTMASGVPDETGPAMVAEVKAAGAPEAVAYQLTRADALKPDSAKVLDGAGGVYFTGGDQARLTAALLDTPVHERLRELYEQGLVLSGTSAGAAVMSEVMITGNEKKTKGGDTGWQTIEADNVETVRGFGFLLDAVIDQHHVIRRRNNRLISVVLEHPGLFGAGIDESTAIWVRPDGKYEIAGLFQVVIYDPRKAEIRKTGSGRLGAVGMTVHVLLPGDVYDPATGKVEGTRP